MPALPPLWKREIQKAVEESADRAAHRRDRQDKEDSTAIARPLHDLVEEFKAYQEKQERSDEEAATRERVTIAAIILTVVFTFITVIIFHSQLDEMKKAYLPVKDQAIAAIAAAESAKAAVELSDKTAERQLRAYINIESVTFAWSGVARSVAEVHIRNAGQTPAKNVIVRGIIADDHDAPPNRLPAYFGDFPSNYGMGQPDSSKITKILGQGREEISNIISITVEATKSVLRKGKPVFPGRVFVIGAVYYSDIFGRPRYTRFCRYYLTPINFDYCAEHNDAN
jgi:uncharacterized protein (UPF0333 family)